MNKLTKSESNVATAEPNDGARVKYLSPLANIVETSDGYVLEAEMPGVSREGLDISIENGQLVITGHRRSYAPKGVTIYRESRDFDYRRVFEIDPSIDGAHITAKMDQGVLKLNLPKAEAVKPRKVKVTD